METVARVSAVVLTIVFAWAGAAKLGSRPRTVRSFRALGLPAVLATAVPIVELAIALGLLVRPAVTSLVAIALLVAFTVVLARAEGDVPCACFGTARAEPVSWVELVRNSMLIGVAVVIAASRTSPAVPGLASVIGAGTGVAILAVVLALADLKRRTGAVLALRLP